MLAAIGTLAAVGYVLLLWRGPWWLDGAHLRTKNLQPADGVVITGLRTMLVALGAGAVAALGLYYTHKGHRQTEALFDHTREKDRKQEELTREGQVTERYVEAIKLLASENLTQRLGGIYSLERIMRDSEKDHSTVLEVLAAFIRRYPHKEEKGDEKKSYEIPEDLQAAFTVLGRRIERKEEISLDVSGAKLADAEVAQARLNNAILKGVNLVGANLFSASLAGANLSRSNLMHVNLSSTHLDRAQLTACRLDGAHFVGASMQVIDMRGASGEQLNFTNANLQSAHMDGAKLVHSNFHDATLDDAVFREAQLSGSQLFGASLQRVTAWRTDLSHCGLILSRMNDADLIGADFQGSDFRQADLSGAYLPGARMNGANLDQAILKGTFLREADLSEIKRCTVEQLLEAQIFPSTILPAYISEDQRIRDRQDACEEEYQQSKDE
ncbi:pentapeptide repeat-containing protein [Streptomyces werraensis]|uniref:pentapeptide repeat-containing protein n=1 Tax=Streptomyces werraensis TaxID=68284 RepID=UPI00343AC251